MSRILLDLSPEDIGTQIRVLYTQVEGTLEDFDLEYEDEVKLVISGETYYLPHDYPFAESTTPEDYDPAVLLGVVDPWTPF